MDPVKRSYWRTALAVVLVFVLGAVAGGFASRAVQHRRMRELILGDPAEMRTQLTLYALTHRLDLTSRQRAEAEQMLRAQEAPYRQALELSRPQIRALRRELARQLGPTLAPDQRALLEELIREGERFR